MVNMDINYNLIETHTTGDLKIKNLRLTRDGTYFTGGVVVSQEEWKNHEYFNLAQDGTTRIYPTLTMGDIITEASALTEGSVVLVDSVLDIIDPFRVTNIEYIEEQAVITLQTFDQKERYLYLSDDLVQNNDKSGVLKSKKKSKSSGFDVKLKKIPTLYTILQFGGKDKITEFQLSYKSKLNL